MPTGFRIPKRLAHAFSSIWSSRNPRLPQRCRPSPRVSNRDDPGRASSRLPLERCYPARAGGGALPVIMSIIRSSAKPTTTATTTSEAAVQSNISSKKPKKREQNMTVGDCYRRTGDAYTTVQQPEGWYHVTWCNTPPKKPLPKKKHPFLRALPFAITSLLRF